MPDPTPITNWQTLEGHECEEIARDNRCGEGREVWIGRLTRPIAGYEHETHCIHIVTPKKGETVFAVYRGDMANWMGTCQVIMDDARSKERKEPGYQSAGSDERAPINDAWVHGTADAFEANARENG